MFDSHLHTHYSFDSMMFVQDACETAIKLGLEGIVVTDHMDNDLVIKGSTFDAFEYKNELNKFREIYEGKLKLLIGIEEGYQPNVVDLIQKDIEIISPDYIICSIHSVHYLDIAFSEFYEGKDRVKAFVEYFEEVIESIDLMPDFDCLGHLGYIKRYAPYGKNNLNYTEFKDYYDEIFKKLIRQGKGLEINTSGLLKFGFTLPDYDILKQYLKAGGEIICLGSDAHHHANIGFQFNEVIKKLPDLGVKYIAHYENRKPVFEKI